MPTGARSECKVGEEGGGGWRMVEVMASATSSNDTGRPNSAESVVTALATCGLRLTAAMISCEPSSRMDPCCKNAFPFRTCAEPTSLRPATSTSPPTGVAKQDLGWSTREDGGGGWGASVAAAPRDRSARAMRSWMVWYACRNEPNAATGAATAEGTRS